MKILMSHVIHVNLLVDVSIELVVATEHDDAAHSNS